MAPRPRGGREVRLSRASCGGLRPRRARHLHRARHLRRARHLHRAHRVARVATAVASFVRAGLASPPPPQARRPGGISPGARLADQPARVPAPPVVRLQAQNSRAWPRFHPRAEHPIVHGVHRTGRALAYELIGNPVQTSCSTPRHVLRPTTRTSVGLCTHIGQELLRTLLPTSESPVGLYLASATTKLSPLGRTRARCAAKISPSARRTSNPQRDVNLVMRIRVGRRILKFFNRHRVVR